IDGHFTAALGGFTDPSGHLDDVTDDIRSNHDDLVAAEASGNLSAIRPMTIWTARAILPAHDSVVGCDGIPFVI
ncbi:MAG: hypothetical protein AAEJ04_00275, partial [Planctomycetota bacterium]